ncbi:MAG: hypothetical protein PHR26_01340, partial [Candidatus ainarchaeum sp.]|nr:hypothetical protein [Candidatus ainarchaeum sp.]
MFLNFLPFSKSKSISPLIATVLIILISLALVVIVLNFSKGFTNTHLSDSSSITVFQSSDAQFYFELKDGLNGRFLAHYIAP